MGRVASSRRVRDLPGLIGILSALVLLPACAHGNAGPVAGGDHLPEYAAATLAGDSVALRDFRGEVLLLNVWATWCPACEREMPSLQRLHEELGPRGLRVVGVSIDPPGSEKTVRQFLEKHGIRFTILYDPRDRISELFGIRGIPTSYVVDRRGVVREVWLGERDFGARGIRAALERALVSERGAGEGDPGNG